MANQSLPVVDSLHFSCLPGGQNACQCAHRILISPKRKNQLDEDEVDMVYSHYLRSFENYVSASEAMLNRLSGRDQLTLHTMTPAARREYEKMMTTANDYQEALERNRKRFEEKVEKFSKTPGLRRTMKRKTAVSPINQKRAVVVRLRQMVRQFDWEANEFRGHILSYERKATKDN